MLPDWPAVSQNLKSAICFSRRFLDSSPEDRAATVDRLGARTAWDLVRAISQAREILRLLEEASEAWVEAGGDKFKRH